MYIFSEKETVSNHLTEENQQLLLVLNEAKNSLFAIQEERDEYKEKITDLTSQIILTSNSQYNINDSYE